MDAKQLLHSLRSTIGKFDEENSSLRLSVLHQLAQQKILLSGWLNEYHHALLFMMGYSSHAEERKLAESELERIAGFLRDTNKDKTAFVGSGLPFTSTLSSFSFDLLQWAEKEFPDQWSFDSFGDGSENIAAVLRHTLPDMEKEILTEEGMKGERLMRRLFGKKKHFHAALLLQASKLDHVPLLRDQLFEAMDMYSLFEPKDKNASLAFNRIDNVSLHYHQSILKKFDHRELIDRRLPKEKKLSASERVHIRNVVRTSLVLLGRETEPSTWMDLASIKIFELEHGISMCIYGMTPDRRQPLESYFGFTAFKNGYPMSYGGAWLFGKRALFGMNIFEWFRGGESAFVFAQLLRTYRQCFGIEYFEVEPYQYGKDNPEGISSGAFWFYHRFGFRLLDKELHVLSEKEAERISNEKGYRTPPTILKNFTRSNIGLRLDSNVTPVSPVAVRDSIAKYVIDNFDGDHARAEKEISATFSRLSGVKAKNAAQKKVLADLAFFVLSGNEITHYLKKKKELQRLIELKTTDETAYQVLLRKVLK